jgi:hypothetical protein
MKLKKEQEKTDARDLIKKQVAINKEKKELVCVPI